METLSDKIHFMKHNYKTCKWVYPADDVKEFIRELKEAIKERDVPVSGIMEKLDKLAGDKLK